MTLHGLTEDNQCVTLLEAMALPSGLSFNKRSSTQSIVVTANCMLLGSDHFDESASVRRVSFASSLVEHVLRLFASLDYKEIRHRKILGGRFERPILQKQAASFVDSGRGIRVRAFRPTVPTTTIEPMSFWTIDFLRLVTPRDALRVLHEFRALLALICGDLVDLWDVHLLHKKGKEHTQSEMYFADHIERPTKSDRFPTLPLLDIAWNRVLFRTVMAAWLGEPPVRKIGRGAFNAILQDKGTLRFSHLRGLVTIIEMQESGADTAPLSTTQSRTLRNALKTALDEFAAKESGSAVWLETMHGRIENINYHDARVRLTNFIAKLPQGLVTVPESFAKDVIDLRNTLVHDMSRIKNEDQKRLHVFVAKLKALYALSDAMALGARPTDISDGSSFLLEAKYSDNIDDLAE
jgi:hypothetical protein